jgi:hypothetical protein
MRFAFLAFTALLATTGCKTDKRPPWHHPSLNIADIDTLTLVFASYYLDGGTTEIYAITDTGRRCSIRLNQHMLLGEYELGTVDSPGRLCFNDQLIAVRSPAEKQLIELLRSARLKPIAVDDLRRLYEADIVTFSNLDAVPSLDDADELRRYQNAIVEYVSTDGYLDAAKSGIPYKPGADG